MAAFALHRYFEFAAMQSRPHELWARFFGSSMGDTLRYTPSDCFDTFPFPPNWETNTALETAGQEYYEYRAALMVRNDEGLTKTYNRFHDPEECSPDIHQLRSLHAAMDRAVLAAYGRPDIPTACEFLLDYDEDEDSEDALEASGKKKGKKKKKPYRYRWPDEVRDEVLARLLALNAERAEQERLTASTKSPSKQPGKKGTVQLPVEGLDLFAAAGQGSTVSTIPDKLIPGKRLPLDPITYFKIVIPILAQLQPEGVEASRLLHALEILSEPEARRSAIKGRSEPILKEWVSGFPKNMDFSSAAAVLLSLVNDGTLLRMRGTLSLPEGTEIQRIPHLEQDALIALGLARSSLAKQATPQEIETRITAKAPSLLFLFKAA